MKKVLTVLLAIAVMFTFSFGSAFAGTPVTDNTQANMIKQAADLAKADLETAVKKAYETVLEKGTGDVTYITKEAWDAAAADIVEALEDKIDAEKEGYLNDADSLTSKTDWDKYDAKYAATVLYTGYAYTDLVTEFSKVNDASAVMAAKEQFKLDVADATAVYDKVDLDALYSKTEPTTGDTYYEQAKKAIEENKDALNNYYFDEKGEVLDEKVGGKNLVTVATIKAEIAAVKSFIKSGRYETDASYKLTAVIAEKYENTEVVKYYYVKDIPKLEDAKVDAALDAATTAAIKAQIAKNVAVFLKNNNTTEDKEFADDYATLFNYLAEEIPNVAKLTTLVSGCNTASDMKTYMSSKSAVIAGAITDIDELEAYAAKYAAEKDATGALVRDAAEVNKLVAKAKLYTYANAVDITEDIEVYTVIAAMSDIAEMTTDGDAAFFAFQKEAKKADLDDEYDAIVDDYYDLEAAQLKAAYEAAKAKVDAAKKDTEFDTIETALAKEVAKIKDTNAVDALFTSGKMQKELAKQADALEAYVDYKNAPVKAYEDAYIVYDNAAALLTEYYINNNARTVEEMQALTAAVEAVAATLPTNADLTAAKKAAEDAVKALPTAAKVVSADKDAFQAALDLVKKYNDMAETAGKASVSMDAAKVNALKAAIQDDINLAYAKADKTDKAALKAIAEEVKTANKDCGSDKLFADEFEDPTVDDLAKIRNNERDVVIAAIRAIPLNVTEADKDVVVKARELYDAYVAEYTNYDLGEDDNYEGYVADEFAGLYHELALAEATLGLNADPEWAAVEALKITAKSTAKKGSITVKWTVKGDAAGVDGYQVWKSTKHNKGYKKAFTTTKKTYKNSKGLKKGTRYYYKVRAYKVVDGKTYYSDWSNKARRVAK